jgi:hypothetical protein
LCVLCCHDLTDFSLCKKWFMPSPFLGTFKNLLPLDGLSCNFVSEDFLKICQENSYSIKIWQELLLRYVKPYTCSW